jgi:maltose O-acetyltransferase
MTGGPEPDAPGATRGILGAVRFEIVLWSTWVLKLIPGQLGAMLRNRFMPYSRGENVTVWDFVHIDRPANLRLGSNVSINRYSTINATGGIVIGDDVLIGPYVLLQSQDHRFDESDVAFNQQGYARHPIRIGNNVWIGAKVTILAGVKVGDNVVIGAGSVVTSDIPDGSLAVGAPARVIRSI